MDEFSRMYPAAAAMEDNRALVRVKYDVAQALGQQITENKQVRSMRAGHERSWNFLVCPVCFSVQ